MDTVVHHSTHELREGLHGALSGAITPQVREVEPELRLAGFLTDTTTVTPAGRRFLQGDGDRGSRLAAAQQGKSACHVNYSPAPPAVSPRRGRPAC